MAFGHGEETRVFEAHGGTTAGTLRMFAASSTRKEIQLLALIRVIAALALATKKSPARIRQAHPALRVTANSIELLAPGLQRCQGALHATGQRVVYTKLA